MTYRLLIRKNKEMVKQEAHTKKLLEESVLHSKERMMGEEQKLPVDDAKELPKTDETEENKSAQCEKTTESTTPDKASATTTADKEENSNGINMSEENKNRLLNSVIEVMNNVEFISKPDFGLNALADAVGSNTRYVSWVINDTYGKNFKTMLNECRIKEACRRLLDKENYGNMTIQAIYEEVGYTNNVSFIRAFKKVNGMTPSEYQRQYRMEETSGQQDSE